MVTKSKKLNQFLKKLLNMSRYDILASPRSAGGGLSLLSEFSRSLNSSHRSSDGLSADVVYASFDCEDASWSENIPPRDVPAGCLPVYVGQERRRFVIPTTYLSNNIFRALLAKSEEEYGLRCEGGLRIACAPDAFEHFLWWLEGETTYYSEEMKHTCSGRSG